MPFIREACLAARLTAQPKIGLQSNQTALLDGNGPSGYSSYESTEDLPYMHRTLHMQMLFQPNAKDLHTMLHLLWCCAATLYLFMFIRRYCTLPVSTPTADLNQHSTLACTHSPMLCSASGMLLRSVTPSQDLHLCRSFILTLHAV